MGTINICTSFDNNYWKYGTIMLYSLLKNLDKKYILNIYILTDGLESNIEAIINNTLISFGAQVYFCEYDKNFFKKNFSQLSLADYISPLTLYRLIIDKIIPGNIDKILYLDSDMIVDFNIEKIYNIDLKDNIIGACKEIYVDISNYNLGGIKIENYFNAGLLLIDLYKWRKYNYTDKILEFIKKHGEKLIVADQDVLNYIFYNKIHYIHPQYNVPTTIYSADDEKKSRYTKEEFFEAKNNPKIIHFFGSLKPWNWITHHPLHYKYFFYLQSAGLANKKDFIKYLFHNGIIFFLHSRTLRKLIRKMYLYKKGTIKDDPL